MLKQRGMSIVELMVAMAIGTIISAALAAIFVTTTKVKHEINRMGEQIENGGIAMDWLSKDLGSAGFWDGLEYTGMTDPSLPDICDTDVADLKSAVPVYVQGINNVAAGTTPACLSDVKLDTDIVVVRRASTCVNGASGCESVAPYFQASNCAPTDDQIAGGAALELRSTLGSGWYEVAANPAGLALQQRNCTTAANIRRYIARIYFVANNDRAGDGLPSLKMAELRSTTWTISTIAAGIEQLQIEYGQSAASTVPASYVAAPGSVAEWRQIVSVKVHIMSRNSSASPDYNDTTKTYVLAGTTFGPFTDKIRRHSFSGLVGIRNPVGLRGG